MPIPSPVVVGAPANIYTVYDTAVMFGGLIALVLVIGLVIAALMWFSDTL